MKNDDEFIDNLQTPIGRGIYRIGTFLMALLMIVCLIGWWKDGLSLWEIIKCEFFLCIISGLVVLAASFVVDIVGRIIKEIFK